MQPPHWRARSSVDRDAVLARAEAVVESEKVGGQCADDRLAVGRDAGQVGVEVGVLLVAGRGDDREPLVGLG